MADTPKSLRVLFEDNHCLAIAKPARLLSVPDQTGDLSLLDIAKAYIKKQYDKPGDVYLGVVHRLDRPVSGVVLFARTSKAAARISEQFREGQVKKLYHAVVEGPARPQEVCADWLLKDEEKNVVKQVGESTPGARKCLLSYRRIRSSGRFCLLQINPETGRSHQIRAQLAFRGMPIAGDLKYGGRQKLDGAIALHATSLSFEHPTRDETLSITDEAPDYFDELVPLPG